jgi:uncharacterized membrane protein
MNRLARRRRKMRRSVLRLKLHAGVLSRRFTVFLRRHKTYTLLTVNAILLALLAFTIGRLLFHHRLTLKTYAETLVANGTVPQLGIAVGAAMLGVIGIVFSLSLFSLQQVAERGTSLTLREYEKDWVLRTVYWCLALFTLLAIVVAMLKKEFALSSIATVFTILIAAILLLKLYFNRTIKFSDPHFTVSQIAKRANKYLNKIQRIERAFQAEMRYARRKGQS